MPRQVAACVADVGALEQELTPRLLRHHRPHFAAAPLVMLDGNLSAEALEVTHMQRCFAMSPECQVYILPLKTNWCTCGLPVLAIRCLAH